ASHLEQATVTTSSDSLIVQSGPQLDRYDLRVYAACLALYRDHALTGPTDAGIEITYGMLGAMVGGRSTSALVALRESLWRLSCTAIATHIHPVDAYRQPPARQVIQFPALVQVDFPEEYAGCSTQTEEGTLLPPSG